LAFVAKIFNGLLAVNAASILWITTLKWFLIL